MERISTNITYAEAVYSNTAKLNGIINKPDANTLLNMKYWAEMIFEPTRRHFGGLPIHVSSFFRCSKLNVLIGGTDNSGHVRGESGDMDGDVYESPSNTQIFEFIRDNLVFDQLIIEGIVDGKIAWVHSSIKRNGRNRNQILFMYKRNGKTVYEKYSEARYKELVYLKKAA